MEQTISPEKPQDKLDRYFRRDLYDRFLELMDQAQDSGFGVVKICFVDKRVDSLRIEIIHRE